MVGFNTAGEQGVLTIGFDSRGRRGRTRGFGPLGRWGIDPAEKGDYSAGFDLMGGGLRGPYQRIRYSGGRGHIREPDPWEGKGHT
jgi:hypothetical protein